MKKILLAEDDASARLLYETVLRDAGFLVDTASDGEESLQKASKGGYDLILTDIMLPKRGGLSVIEHLQSHPPEIPNGPIVVFSSLSHEDVIQEAKQLNVAGFINKLDYTPDQLVEKIKSFMTA